ncbi:YbaB/EbfC family nucleoid-associated protein [Actinoplanes sp. CA-030573]|uniref:YbaB/EbfC family nucleoid-associated protein n=1 Tax=Actinoplanes sp. CA-030573 TaxID=3239898 RepID=UPI003D8E1144
MTDLSGGGFLDPDASMAYLQNWKGRVDKMAADTQAMSARLGDLRVTAEDDNGLARVTIDANGVLLDVHLSDRIHRFAPEAVSRAMMSAFGKARRKAAEQSRDIITATMGADSIAGRTIAERVEQQLRSHEEGRLAGDER